MTFFSCLIAGSSLLTSPDSFANDVCTELSNHIDRDSTQLNDFLITQKELNEKFQGYVAEDFNAQSEGISDSLHRNAAIKVAFAKKKLARNIESKKTAIIENKQSFCKRCENTAKNNFARVSFCKKCPEKKFCAGMEKFEIPTSVDKSDSFSPEMALPSPSIQNSDEPVKYDFR